MSLSSPVVANAHMRTEQIASAILKLDAWLQTMRSSTGYSGPISHWWESCLVYCGTMIDWRYEGLVAGYVHLFESTGNLVWLNRARQAAEDVVSAQLSSGHFRNSSFQQGAVEGGTPHEAAVDVGLLELARLLKRLGDETWLRYFDVAQHNIVNYLLGSLWNGRGFQEQSWDSTLVPNKNATVIDALLLYEELSGRDFSSYIEAALHVILSAQEHVGARAGGTVHTGTHAQRLAIGIYTARSMCAVLRLYQRAPRSALLDAVGEALSFLNRLISEHGTCFGFYRDQKLIANPRWIAPSGDLLRAAILADDYGLTPSGMIDKLVDLLIQHQLPSGAIPTAFGFAELGSSRPYVGLPEFRDVLPVVGWCDKAFRALCMLLPSTAEVNQVETRPCEIDCTWKGKLCTYFENEKEIGLRENATGQVRYRWCKGQAWSDVFAL